MDLILKLFALFYTILIHRIERNLGYKIKFKNIPKAWIDGWMTFDMERSWRKQGIQAKGINYFTMGTISNGISSRFLRDKKQYQSWLGAYLVIFKDKKKFKLQDYYNLVVADQKNWLTDFGDPHPYIKMPEQNTTEIKNIQIGNYKGKLYKFLGGPSHSDVGKNSDNIRNRIFMSLMASMFNRINPKLNLKGSNFIPQNPAKNYETIILNGYIVVIDLEDDVKVVLYGNGATIRDEKVNNIDYYISLEKDILNVFKSIIIKKAK